MRAQVCEIQDPCKSNSLLANICLIFVLSKGSTQETVSYLGTIQKLILQCKSGGQYLSTPLINMVLYNTWIRTATEKLYTDTGWVT